MAGGLGSVVIAALPPSADEGSAPVSVREVERVLVTALKARGTPVGYFLFDGEQHGFREADNFRDANLSFSKTSGSLTPVMVKRNA
jgi:hypothetical protein